ncbi:carbohydrate porin [Vibrio tubiashii]|uniref:LamB n=1 Tax=Vibrio tubiashii ATCC 19109 TaxID=1051646 RepID=F9TCL7_9VIBR|nr:carbohydrate porin [Vibrio tubiashii]AIW14666.1 LamB [Vibrio tubiashii ATCC 19109]EGU47680.1 outer membrane porin [Vibrio tubiashii ATCC 19109]EIF02365.1 putative maltoporin [Vibrio tubiashii NCIMB 1337 = ATCC 19106]
MKKLKLLPISIAVAASLASVTSFATETELQALEQRIQELESRMQTDYVNDQQPAVLSPDIEVPLGVVFSGYARYGAHYQSGDQKYVQVDGSFNGSSAIGRLGNEGNGGEFQLAKVFQSDNGAIWDVVVMFDHWGDEVNIKKAYAGATNVFESQPNAYVWAGRDFHQRPQQGINDYFWMMHDGQGGGINNLELGSVKLDFGVVGAVDSCSPTIEPGANPSINCTGGAGTGDSGAYAFTSKLHGINLGFADLELYANYGFDSEAIDDAKSINAYQLGAVFSRPNNNGSNRLVLRYSDNADNGVFWKTDNLTTLYASFEGNSTLGESAAVEYLLAYHDYSVDGSSKVEDERTNYSAIVRPMYFWNDVHSTWLEAGYQVVDYARASDDNSGWKVTLSQNIAFDWGSGARPMLRFYATAGEVDNKATATTTAKQDTFSLGAMWEAWW